MATHMLGDLACQQFFLFRNSCPRSCGPIPCLLSLRLVSILWIGRPHAHCIGIGWLPYALPPGSTHRFQYATFVRERLGEMAGLRDREILSTPRDALRGQ